MEMLPNEEEGFQLWLCELLASHETLRENRIMANFLKSFLNRIQLHHTTHGGNSNSNYLLRCRGQERILVTSEQAQQQKGVGTYSYARWYDFVKVMPVARCSGGCVLVKNNEQQQTRQQFETLCIKVEASRNRAKFGMTDDTGYLFPCLQQNLPRACFVVMNHETDNVFLLHGNKKFAGQGDEGLEEGTTTTATTTDIHAPPVKCFPGTEQLDPTHYIFTWKANGKNAGVYGHYDSNGVVWLFINSKGVCECAGKLQDVLAPSSSNDTINITQFSDRAVEDPSNLMLPIFRCFRDIWLNGGINQTLMLSLWKQGYLFLFEFCDNKHVVLEYGKDGRPIDHCAFIGMVRQPSESNSGNVDSLHSGLVFEVQGQFTFDLWRRDIQGPPQTCKPTLYVRPEHLELATRQLMKGRFFYRTTNTSSGTTEWFDPDSSANKQYLAGEGAVCYEMADSGTGDTTSVIRQLFKAKTASYITRRQFRAFLQRGRGKANDNKKRNDQSRVMTFPVFHRRVLQFCRQKFGDLAEKPYPKLEEFCHDVSVENVVKAAALFYAHFGMWLEDMADRLDSTIPVLLGFNNTDSFIPAESPLGQEYRKTTEKMGLLEEDILARNTEDPMLTLRCGMAFRVAEFMASYKLDETKIFANPIGMIKDLEENNNFVWDNVPTGYAGTILVGFNLAFPGGVRPKKKTKMEKKQRGPKHDALAQFRRSFAAFLAANPNVNVRLGKPDDKPESMVFTLSEGLQAEVTGGCLEASTLSEGLQAEVTSDCVEASTLSEGLQAAVTSDCVETFKSSLMALTNLSNEKSQTSEITADSQRMDREGATRQAEDVLRRRFSTIDELFDSPVDLQLGDVTGRLIPMIRATGSGPQMLIIRGVSGVGKSTLARACQDIWGTREVSICEADDYFGPTCPYHADLLTVAHTYSQNKARAALHDSTVKLVVVSNTGISAKEYAEYLHMASDAHAAVSILTLDTETPLSHLENIHFVAPEKVEKMGIGLRAPENDPEGKTLEEIFVISGEQMLKDKFSSSSALAWTLLGTEGVSSLREIYVGFLEFAKEQGIVLLPRTIRPSNPHVTLAFAKNSSPDDKKKTVFELWDAHGTTQEMEVDEVRFSIRTVGQGTEQQKCLMNMAVQVKSLTPNLTEAETPHITMAYDPDHASAVDSNKLWKSDATWPPNVTVSTWNFQPSRPVFSGVVETGTRRESGLVHRMPYWLRVTSNDTGDA